jgi:hypothetical protein
MSESNRAGTVAAGVVAFCGEAASAGTMERAIRATVARVRIARLIFKRNIGNSSNCAGFVRPGSQSGYLSDGSGADLEEKI